MTDPLSIALGFVTIERPQVARRLIKSARRHLGSIPIYVADQSRDISAMASFYQENDVQLVRMPYDIGVTASRNRLACEIREDYFVLCDDDFVMGPQTDFRDAVSILQSGTEIGVVGGRLYDFDGKEERVRNWEIYLEYDPLQRILVSIPIYDLAPRARELGGVRYFLCDAVLNFSVMRRDIFANGILWDERFKSNGEHEDFFLNLKLNTPYRVAYLPTMRAYHHHPEEYHQYRRRLRDRNEGWRQFFEKWGIDQHLEYGLGVKSIDDVSTVTAEDHARARFFINPELSLRREQESPNALLVDRAGVIATVGSLDQRGEPPAETARKYGSLLLDRRCNSLVAFPAEPASVDGVRSEGLGPLEKYQLEASFDRRAVSTADGEIYYWYDPVWRCDLDFIVWYFRKDAAGMCRSIHERLAIVARWTADDGTTALWRTRRTYIDLEPATHWRPLLLETPIAPRAARWLRFELIGDGGPEADPVGSGFVFLSAERCAARIRALGLTRLPRDGAMPGSKGRRLEELGRTCRAFQVSLKQLAFGAALLPLDQCTGLEVLFFHNWKGLGRALVSARLPHTALNGPDAIVLPSADFGSADARIYGFGAKVGLVRMQFSPAAA